MNKSKAKRLRKELEHEQKAADRGYQVKAKQIEERRRRTLAPRQLSDVQKAVHFEPGA